MGTSIVSFLSFSSNHNKASDRTSQSCVCVLLVCFVEQLCQHTREFFSPFYFMKQNYKDIFTFIADCNGEHQFLSLFLHHSVKLLRHELFCCCLKPIFIVVEKLLTAVWGLKWSQCSRAYLFWVCLLGFFLFFMFG